MSLDQKFNGKQLRPKNKHNKKIDDNIMLVQNKIEDEFHETFEEELTFSNEKNSSTWIQCESAKGEIYFYNPDTQVVQWEDPICDNVSNKYSTNLNLKYNDSISTKDIQQLSYAKPENSYQPIKKKGMVTYTTTSSVNGEYYRKISQHIPDLELNNTYYNSTSQSHKDNPINPFQEQYYANEVVDIQYNNSNLPQEPYYTTEIVDIQYNNSNLPQEPYYTTEDEDIQYNNSNVPQEPYYTTEDEDIQYNNSNVPQEPYYTTEVVNIQYNNSNEPQEPYYTTEDVGIQYNNNNVLREPYYIPYHINNGIELDNYSTEIYNNESDIYDKNNFNTYIEDFVQGTGTAYSTIGSLIARDRLSSMVGIMVGHSNASQSVVSSLSDNSLNAASPVVTPSSIAISGNTMKTVLANAVAVAVSNKYTVESVININEQHNLFDDKMDFREKDIDDIDDNKSNSNNNSTSNNTQRHLDIWNRFFKNALLMNNYRDENSENAREILVTKAILKIKKQALFSKSKGARAAALWPKTLSQPKYDSLISLALKTNSEQVKFNEENEETILKELIGVNKTGCLCSIDGSIESSALLVATLHGDLTSVEALLHKGANPNCIDSLLRTPVHYCAHTGNVTLLALFYDHGADLESSDAAGRRPLHTSAIFGHSEMIEFLCGCAVDCNSVDLVGHSSLHFAARGGFVDVCENLISFGVSLETANHTGLKALDMARAIRPQTQGLLEVVKLLSGNAYTDNVITSLNESIENNNIEIDSHPVQQNISMTEFYSSKSDLSSKENHFYSNKVDYLKAKARFSLSQKSRVDENIEILKRNATSVVYENSINIDDSIEQSKFHQVNTNPILIVNSDSNQEEISQPIVNIGLEIAEEDDEDDEVELEQDNTVADMIASSVWGIASTLIDATLSMFGNYKINNENKNTINTERKKKNSIWSIWGSSNSNENCYDGALTRKSVEFGSGDGDNSHLIQPYSIAPPTDQELYRKGMTFAMPTSDRYIATPFRNDSNLIPMTPPSEVQVAVAISRSNSLRRNNTDPFKVYDNNPKPIPPPLDLLRNVDKHDTLSNNDHSLPFVAQPTVAANNYSIGSSLPRGAAWRYVDVLNKNN